MNTINTEICEEILVQLRKIVRAMSIYSRQLQREYALTAPQLVLLREIARQDDSPIGALAERVSLSNATVTGIVDRLEQRGLARRVRGTDRRQVLIASTQAGRDLCETAPPLLQERFVAALSGLKQWEQAQLLSSMSRVAAMMSNGVQIEREMGEASASQEPEGFIASCRMLLDKAPMEALLASESEGGVIVRCVREDGDFPEGVSRESLALFLHKHLQPYEDALDDIGRGIDHALLHEQAQGGFILLALAGGGLAGALVMLDTGMSGYVPERLLLFVAVDASLRGQGIGAQLVQRAQQECRGAVKLHVEYDNPARRLYERLGFSSKYAEMRWTYEPGEHQS